MGTFTAQFTARSAIRIHEKPAIEDRADSILLEWPARDFALVLFDRQVTLDGTRVPWGLMAHVQVEAESIEQATGMARSAAVAAMSICSCVSRGAIQLPRIQWIYDATDGVTERQLHHFVYDPYLAMATRNVDREALFNWLDQLFHDVAEREALTEERKTRLWQAITSFRRGLADNDDVLTEFVIQWSLLEMLDVVYRETFEIEVERIYTRCRCGERRWKCVACGTEKLHGRRGELAGAKAVFVALDAEDEFGEVSQLRNGIVHGYKKIDECVATARQHLELVRTAVLTMIMEILGVEDDVRKAVQDLTSIKGKFEPYVKFKAHGTFAPQGINQVHGHPGLEATGHEVEASTSNEGRKLHLSPKCLFTARNVEQIAVSGYEIWGEEGREVEITAIEARVIKKSEASDLETDKEP